MKKIIYIHILISISLVSCSKVSDLSNNFNLKSDISTIKESSPPKQLPYNPVVPNVKLDKFNNTQAKKSESFIEKVKRTRFDLSPPKNLPTVSGKITVIYKNNYKIRIDQDSKKTISSLTNTDLLNTILTQNNVITISTSNDFKKDEELDMEHQKIYSTLGIDTPHAKSIHFYQFPKSIDTNEICEKIKKLPYVLNAYPTLKAQTIGSATLISRLTPSYNGTKPTEPWFNNGTIQGVTRNETNHWWWYNKERIFEGWDLYKQAFNSNTINNSSILPTIAIIDSGFDTLSNAPDRPNYDLINSKRYMYNNNGYITYDGNIFDYTPDIYNKDMDNVVFSHGSAVASVAASPIDNGVNLGGVAPGAKIVGYKLETNDEALILAAFQDININNNIDVINLSLGFGNYPVIISPVIGSAILSSWINSQKITVIGAGNSALNIDSALDYDSENPTPLNQREYGQIIVGGTMLDKTNNGINYATFKPVAWVSSSTKGSNYGDMIDIAAGASDIFASSYTPVAGNTNNQNLGIRQVYRLEGTSFAVPQVSATVGMMKKLAIKKGFDFSELDPISIREILSFSSSLYRYSKYFPQGAASESKFIGRDLNNGSNENREVGVRSLNMFNALTIISNIHNYKALMRFSNIDDSVWSAKNYNWVADKFNDSNDIMGNDSIWGINNIIPGDKLAYTTYNSGYGAYTYGYHVFFRNNAKTRFYTCEEMSGVSGVVGANNNIQVNGNSYYGTKDCNYSP